MKEALLYSKLQDKKVSCELCAHRCVIPENKRGICGVRENREGKLYSLNYGMAVATHVDPIEKKPLFNFFPGSLAFSVATVGCNMSCLHCQNADISQSPSNSGSIVGQKISPQALVKAAREEGCRSIAYTYTEPTIFFEYALDTARLAFDKGLKNIFVTNGYMSAAALNKIAPVLSAANVDLKAFKDEFYREICGAHLQPVLDTIKLMYDLGIWLEVTTLIIPDYNDSDEELESTARFLNDISPDIPWHVSAFYPTYRLTSAPRTPVSTLRRARDIGRSAGLHYVYTGNIPGDTGENTFCSNCGKLIIERTGYRLGIINLRDGNCIFCGTPAAGVW